MNIRLKAGTRIDIPPGQWAFIETSNVVQIPDDATYYGMIVGRKSIASKHRVIVQTGVVKPGWNGAVQLQICNTGKSVYEIRDGDEIANLVLMQGYFQ